jgi:4-diphosphocytidyl-2-C-methyl-D-erythritol kinase
VETITTAFAYAKLTRSLRVVGRRDDGYHLLEAEMVTVDLADELLLAPGSGLVVRDATRWYPDEGSAGLSEGFSVPDDATNLVSRALRLAGADLHVELVKHIPAGAGLGGGSADAAAILRHLGFSDMTAAAELGSDVPFCVSGGRALVSGVGDKLIPLEPVDFAFVVVTPPFGVSTGAVYAAFDELGGVGDPSGENDLAPAAHLVEPRLLRWRDLVGEATGCPPILAGSGASHFVECKAEACDRLVDAVRARVKAGGYRALITSVRTVSAMSI